MPTPPSLCNLPDAVIRNIFNRVGFRTIQNLRKVCHDLRIRIDDIKPEGDLSDVRIYVAHSKIYLIYRSPFDNIFDSTFRYKIAYMKTDASEMCTVAYYCKERMVNVDYMELALRDLMLILKFQKKSIETISFKNGTEYFDNFLQFLETLKSFLALENRLLKVDNVHINLADQKSVITALSLIDPRSIKWICLGNLNAEIQPMEFPKIMEMEHWKTAKHFKSDFLFTDVSVRNFRHFSNFFVSLQSISAEEMFDLKKNFQNSTEAEDYTIFYNTFVDREQVFEKMGPTLMTDSDDFECFFRMSTSDDYVLRIGLDDLFRSIQFSRNAMALVPEHAVIQN